MGAFAPLPFKQFGWEDLLRGRCQSEARGQEIDRVPVFAWLTGDAPRKAGVHVLERRIKACPIAQIANRNLCRAVFPYDAALLRVRSQPANIHSTLCERWCNETGEFARPAYGGDRRCLYRLFSHKYDFRLQQDSCAPGRSESLRSVHNFSRELTSELAMNPHEDSVPFGSCEPIIFGGGTRLELLQKSRLQAGGCRSGGA
jgi:hypothetical protein